MLNNQSFNVSDDNCALRGVDSFNRGPANLHPLAMMFSCVHTEEHVVLEKVHVGSVADVAFHTLWSEAGQTNGEAAT